MSQHVNHVMTCCSPLADRGKGWGGGGGLDWEGEGARDTHFQFSNLFQFFFPFSCSFREILTKMTGLCPNLLA